MNPGSIASSKAHKGKKRNPLLANPITTDRHYSEAEVEYLKAVEEFKKTAGTKFPTVIQLFHVFQSLGYKRDEVSSERLVG